MLRKEDDDNKVGMPLYAIRFLVIALKCCSAPKKRRAELLISRSIILTNVINNNANY